MNLFLFRKLSVGFISFFISINLLYSLEFTQEEQNWIVGHPIIKVGAAPDMVPFDFFENGKYQGIASDYLSILGEKTGLKFDIQTDLWANNLKKLQNKSIDLLPALYYTEERAVYMEYTKPYFEMLDYIFIRNDIDVTSIEELNGRIVAIPEGYAQIDIVKKEFPFIKILTVPTFNDAIDAVLENRADLLFDTYASTSYILRKESIDTIIPFASYRGDSKENFYMATFKENLIFMSILNKVLSDITQGEKSTIRNKWLSFENEVLIDYTIAYQILGIFIFFILGTLYWYRKLNAEIRKRETSEAQMSMLMDSIPLSVIVSGFDGGVLRANNFALNIFKIAPEDIYNHNVMEFYVKSEERDSIINTIKNEGRVNDEIVKFRKLDKTEMNILLSIIPISYDSKPALLSIMVDLSDRIEMEEDLRKAKKVADNANKSKSEFLANMSHEIRTPMNAIIGFTELLDEQMTKPRLKTYTKIIKSAGHSLLTLINDILDLSKIEAGKLVITRTAVNVNDIVNDVASIFSMTVGNKGLSIVLDIDENIPKSLLLDGIRLRQVLVNLVGNAVKFTDEGYIKVSIHAFNVDDHLSKLDLEISIEDTGIGISQDQRENIFLSFEQQEGQDNRKFGGTGLGLSISKRLVEMMDGTIMVQSTEKKGATFFIYLYGVDISSIQINEDEKIQKDMNKIIFKPAKILIVDDIEDNRELIVRNFEDTDIEIVTAADGIEAISQLEKENPDLILMDIRMPNMDGYEATRKIREMGNAVPIVALTTSVMRDEYEQMKSQDFNGYLRKPILRNDLFSALSDYLAYESIDIVETNHPKDIFTLDDLAIQNITKILETLDTVIMPLHEKAILNNSISDIEDFSVEVYALAQLYKIVPLEEYAMQLNKAVDSFDIIQLQSLLREFTSLNKKFHLP